MPVSLVRMVTSVASARAALNQLATGTLSTTRMVTRLTTGLVCLLAQYPTLEVQDVARLLAAAARLRELEHGLNHSIRNTAAALGVRNDQMFSICHFNILELFDVNISIINLEHFY